MKFDRVNLSQHLQRLMCGGQIKEAVFTGAFGAAAVTKDLQLVVLAPPLVKSKGLRKEPFGLADLPKFVRALAVLSGSGNEAIKVDLRMQEHYLIIDEETRGVLRMHTADPKTIMTRIEDDDVAKLVKTVKPGQCTLPLTRALLDGMRATFGLFKATEIELFVGPDGGKVRVGNDKADTAEFASEALKASSEYSLLFGEHFVDVCSVVVNYNDAVLHLHGPDKIVAIDDGDFRYLLVPRARGEE